MYVILEQKDAKLQARNCTFVGNNADRGGAIFVKVPGVALTATGTEQTKLNKTHLLPL